MVKFRFQDLEIWKLSIDIAEELFDIADDLDKKRLFRFAEQLRGAGMSMSNNTSEGSGSNSKKEFTLALQKSKMPQIQGIEGEAVVTYRKPSITKEMRYPRLSRKGKKHGKFNGFLQFTFG